MTCRTCKHNSSGRCAILDFYILVRTVSKKDGNYTETKSVAVVKDKAMDNFGCNHYEVKSK